MREATRIVRPIDMRRRFAWLAAAVGLATTTVVVAQSVGPQNPPLIIRSLVGKDSFEFYCASCHGRDAAGHGPAADRLKTPPPALRLLARRNGGTFPRERVTSFVTNGDASAVEHRPNDMPAWGPAFGGLDRSDALVTIRITNLVQYLESLQVPWSRLPDSRRIDGVAATARRADDRAGHQLDGDA